MKYNPNRDIPKAIRELKTFSPKQISEWVQQHRTEKDAYGKRKQVEVSRQSISMWFKRHPEELEALKNEVKQEVLPKAAISEHLFENGVFYEVPEVKKWVRDMKTRGAKGVKPKTITHWVGMLKRVCKGQIGNELIPEWGLKHPRYLSIELAKEYLFQMAERKRRTREYRLMLRNFLTAKGIVVTSSDISGELEEDAGKYADLFVSKPKVYDTLHYIRDLNEEAYGACLFGYTTASRKYAVLTAHAQFINRAEKTITVLEKAVARKDKRKFTKIIRPDVWELIKDRKGLLFNIEGNELNNLCKTAYKEIIPEVAGRIPMPFHFWRHMFAQHMLRATGWNYGLVASLGGWAVETLRRYYGMPPQEVIRNFGFKYLPEI